MQVMSIVRQMVMVGLLLVLVAVGEADQRICTIPYSDEQKPLHFMVRLESGEGEAVYAPTILLVDPQGRYAYVISSGSSQTITVDIKNKKPLADTIGSNMNSRVDADGNLWYVIDSKKDVGNHEEIIFHFCITSPLGWKKTPDTLRQKYSWIKEMKLDSRDINFELECFIDLKEANGNIYFLWHATDKNKHDDIIVNLLTKEEIYRANDILLIHSFMPFVKDELIYIYGDLPCDKFKDLPSVVEKLSDGTNRELTNYCGRKIEVYNLQTRKLVRQYQLPASGQLSPEEKNAGEAYTHLRMDGRGHHYVEVVPNGAERQILETEFGEMVVSPRLILEYDVSGQFVGVRGKVYCPSFYGVETGDKTYWDVDKAGNLYYLQWTKNGVEVWLSPAKSAAKQPQ
jgi:DNA-binding beta-propeller fold protein YncE